MTDIKKTTARRNVLKGTAAAAAGVVAAPMVAAQNWPHQHALAKHLACQGHLPRVRTRLRKKGQRHDRWRLED